MVSAPQRDVQMVVSMVVWLSSRGGRGGRSKGQQGRTQTALEADIWVLPGRCTAMRSRSYIIDGYTRPVPGKAERAPEIGICTAVARDC